jgi:protein SCO1
MNQKMKIVSIYVATAVFCAGIIKTAFWVREGFAERDQPYVTNVGTEKIEDFFPIQQDFSAKNQKGDVVKLSALKGKVWVICEFFAVCPQCAMRNGAELRQLIETFGADPNFQLVCVSIDPMEDSVEKIAEYASVLNADAKNWWFLTNGDTTATHDFMEKSMKFFTPKLRTEPADIESNGKYAHDLGLALVNSNFDVVGKWPLAESRELGPAKYEEVKAQMYQRIRQELDLKP